MVVCVFVPKTILDSATEHWGIKVSRVEIKDVRIPVSMQRAMAAEAEAAQEAKAKVRSTAMSAPSSRVIVQGIHVLVCVLFILKVDLTTVSLCYFCFSYFAGCGSRGRNEGF